LEQNSNLQRIRGANLLTGQEVMVRESLKNPDAAVKHRPIPITYAYKPTNTVRYLCAVLELIRAAGERCRCHHISPYFEKLSLEIPLRPQYLQYLLTTIDTVETNLDRFIGRGS
jgi:hypothetical protein